MAKLMGRLLQHHARVEWAAIGEAREAPADG
jgi:hypothetical protein